MAGQETQFNIFLKQRAPIKSLYMAEGLPLRNLFALSILKNPPHPNASRVFVNWLFAEEGQRVAKGSSPNRKGVTDFSPVSQLIAPQAKVFFPQNKEIDLEGSRLVREKVIQKLMGLEQ